MRSIVYLMALLIVVGLIFPLVADAALFRSACPSCQGLACATPAAIPAPPAVVSPCAPALPQACHPAAIRETRIAFRPLARLRAWWQARRR